MTSSSASTDRPSAARPVVALAFQTGEAANGGLESFTLVVRSLKRHVVRIVTQAEGDRSRAWRDAGYSVEVVRVSPTAREWTWRSRMSALRARIPELARVQRIVAEVARSAGAKVVYFNDQNAFSFGFLGARAAGARVVVALRGTTGTERWRWFTIATLADVVVCLSDDMRRRFEAHLDARDPRRMLPRARLLTIPSIVHPPSELLPRAEARARLGLPADERVLLMAAAVVPLKRQRDVVEALGPRLERLGAKLYFVGDFRPESSPYAASCEAVRKRSEGAERIRFVGYTREVATWYRAADLVVIGSDDEGLARAMLEALAHAVPVVSTDVCSAREVLEGSGAGEVVAVGAFEELAAAVERMLAEPARLTERGAAGRAFVRERFDAERVGEAFDALFEQLAGASR